MEQTHKETDRRRHGKTYRPRRAEPRRSLPLALASALALADHQPTHAPVRTPHGLAARHRAPRPAPDAAGDTAARVCRGRRAHSCRLLGGIRLARAFLRE